MRGIGAIIAALLLVTAQAGEIAPEQRRSGYSFMAPDTRAMQDDDTSNPGMLWVLDGEALVKVALVLKSSDHGAERRCQELLNQERPVCLGE